MGNLQNCVLRIFPRLRIFFLLHIFLIQICFSYADSHAGKNLNFWQKSFAIKDMQFSAFDDLDLSLPLQNCWTYSFLNKSIQNIASDNEQNLYLSFTNGEIISVNTNSGDLIWKTDLGGKIISETHIDTKNIYLVSTNHSKIFSEPNADAAMNANSKNEIKIRSLIKTTGLTSWEIKLPAASNRQSENVFLIGSSNDIIVIEKQGKIFRINKNSGQIIWQVEINIELSTNPILVSDMIIFGTFDKQIILFPLENKKISKIKTSSAPNVLFTNDFDRNIIWGDKKGFLNSANFAVESEKYFKKNWKFRNGGEISHIVKTKEGLLITSFDNFVYLISEKNGELIWKRRFSGRIAFEPLIDGKFAVINVVGDSSAYILENSGGKIVNKIYVENNNFFTAPALKIKNKIIFPTYRGLLSFSQKGCSITTSNLKIK